jgi:antitoxin (DNA-binding transcriptional repressor) of toxin-antitoxin stability system
MSTIIDIREAKTHLSRIVEEVAAGAGIHPDSTCA